MVVRFCKLTHPEYATDEEADRKNQVTSTASHRIPGIVCDVCGPWSSSKRVRVSLPSDAEELDGVRFLPMQDWVQARPAWARLLSVAPDDIAPGAKVGPPIGTCTSAIREDVVHPTPGEIWVTARVRDALLAAALAGVSFAQVRLS